MPKPKKVRRTGKRVAHMPSVVDRQIIEQCRAGINRLKKGLTKATPFAKKMIRQEIAERQRLLKQYIKDIRRG